MNVLSVAYVIRTAKISTYDIGKEAGEHLNSFLDTKLDLDKNTGCDMIEVIVKLDDTVRTKLLEKQFKDSDVNKIVLDINKIELKPETEDENKDPKGFIYLGVGVVMITTYILIWNPFDKPINFVKILTTGVVALNSILEVIKGGKKD